jgi:predicted hydrocarbon binding protein
MATDAVQPVHPIIPLAVLEAMRSVDLPPEDGLGELDDDLASKRLGMSRIVADQIARYARLVRRGASVDSEEVVGLLRLVARRADAARVFVDAGRRAAGHAVARLSGAARLTRRALPGFARWRFGLVLAASALRRSLGAVLARADGSVIVTLEDPPTARATPGGTACELYAAAATALLGQLTEREWVVSHPSCKARGDHNCRWVVRRDK